MALPIVLRRRSSQRPELEETEPPPETYKSKRLVHWPEQKSLSSKAKEAGIKRKPEPRIDTEATGH